MYLNLKYMEYVFENFLVLLVLTVPFRGSFPESVLPGIRVVVTVKSAMCPCPAVAQQAVTWLLSMEAVVLSQPLASADLYPAMCEPQYLQALIHGELLATCGSLIRGELLATCGLPESLVLKKQNKTKPRI